MHTQYSLAVDVYEPHVHRMYRGKDVRSTLDHAFPRLRHRDWCTGGQEDWFVTTAQG